MGCNPVRWSRRAVVEPSAGFALLIVLWTLVLVAFLVLHLATGGHTEMRIATNLESNAVVAAAADGAISAAIFNLTAPQPDERWPTNGTPHELTIGNCRVVVQVENEAARINPNLASPALLEALLRVVGTDPQSARRIAQAIVDWVGSSPTPTPPDTLKAQYQAAGLDYAPPGAPLVSLDELSRILGVAPELYLTLRPHLTLYGPPQPDPAGLDAVVAAAVAETPPVAQAQIPSAQAAPDTMTARIIATATGLGNATSSRTAIVRLSPSLPQGYAVLAWRDTND
jgi:general secretion pathway protein K